VCTQYIVLDDNSNIFSGLHKYASLLVLCKFLEVSSMDWNNTAGNDDETGKE
jgi:hypothetical protein